MKLALFFAFGLFAFPHRSGPSEPIKLATPAVMTLGVAQPMVLCTTCGNALYCYLLAGVPAHTSDFSATGLYLGQHANCVVNSPGGFCAGHGVCPLIDTFNGADSRELDKLAVLLAEGKDVVEELMLRFPSHIEFVPERRGVAVRRCGQVIAFRELYRLDQETFVGASLE